MIGPQHLFVLEPDTEVRTKDGDMETERVAAWSCSIRRDENQYRVNGAPGDVWIDMADVRYVVDLTDDAFQRINIGGGAGTTHQGP